MLQWKRYSILLKWKYITLLLTYSEQAVQSHSRYAFLPEWVFHESFYWLCFLSYSEDAHTNCWCRVSSVLEICEYIIYTHSEGPYIFDDYKKVRLGESYDGSPALSGWTTQLLPYYASLCVIAHRFSLEAAQQGCCLSLPWLKTEFLAKQDAFVIYASVLFFFHVSMLVNILYLLNLHACNLCLLEIKVSPLNICNYNKVSVSDLWLDI